MFIKSIVAFLMLFSWASYAQTNVLDQSAIVPGALTTGAGAFVSAGANYAVSDYTPVAGAATLTSNRILFCSDGYGPFFYTSDHTVISGNGGLFTTGDPTTAYCGPAAGVNDIPAGTALTVPSNAAYFRGFIVVGAGVPNHAQQSQSGWTLTIPAVVVTDAYVSLTTQPPSTVALGGNMGTVVAKIITTTGSVDTANNSSILFSITGPNGYSQSLAVSTVNGVATANLSSYTFATGGTYTLTVSLSGITSAVAHTLAVTTSVPAMVSITHTGIGDGSGGLLANGLECFTPATNNGSAIPAIYSGTNSQGATITGTVTKAQKCGVITNGVLESNFKLINSLATTPNNLCYTITIQDTDRQQQIIGPKDGYACVQVTSATELSTVPPNLPSLVVQTVGAQGPQGPAGPAGQNGTNGTGGVPITQVAAQLQAALPLYNNLFDPARATLNAAVIYPGGPPFQSVPQYTSGASGFNRAGLIPVAGMTYVASNYALHTNSGYGPAFIDINGNFMPATGALLGFIQAGAGIPAGTAIAVPPTAAFFVPYLNATAGQSGNNGSQDYATWMIEVSNSSPVVFPSTYQAFIGAGGSTDTTARANAIAALNAAKPMTGENCMMIGDSITYGQGSNLYLPPLVAAITGCTDYGSVAWSGRRMHDALNNTGNTGSPFPTSTSVAATNTIILWLGTNLDGNPSSSIGTATDNPSTGTTGANGITFPSSDTYASQLKGVVNQLLAWNPNVRIIKVSPYQNSNQNGNAGCTPYPAAPCATALSYLQQVTTLDKAILGPQYSIPVLDMFDELGINSRNINTLTVDYVHPTAATQTNIIAPFIAHKISNYAHK